jgi:hypothetical protein
MDNLPDDAWVLRGGTMQSKDLDGNAIDHHDEFSGEWAISVWSAANMEIPALASRSQIRNGELRAARVSAIRDLGHDVVPDPDPAEFPHANLKLREEPSEPLWEELRNAFAIHLENRWRYKGP